MINKLKSLFLADNPEVIASENNDNKNLIVFNKFLLSIKDNNDVPNKVKQTLEDTFVLLEKSNFNNLKIDLRLDILKIIEIEIPKNINLYLNLPKAYAVSFILDNGKTSKTVLIEKLINYYDDIFKILDNQNNVLSNSLMDENKKPPKIEVDFFDM